MEIAKLEITPPSLPASDRSGMAALRLGPGQSGIQGIQDNTGMQQDTIASKRERTLSTILYCQFDTLILVVHKCS